MFILLTFSACSDKSASSDSAQAGGSFGKESPFKQTIENLCKNDINFKIESYRGAAKLSAASIDLDNDGVDEVILYITAEYDKNGSVSSFRVLDYEHGKVSVNNLLGVGMSSTGSLILSTKGYLYQPRLSETMETYYIYEYANNHTKTNKLSYSNLKFGDSPPSITYEFDNRKISQSEYNTYISNYGLNGGTMVVDKVPD